MWNNFFKHIDIKAENTHILDGNAADLQAECDAFEEKITAAGGIELFVGGQEVTVLFLNTKYNQDLVFWQLKLKLLVLSCQVSDQMATLPSMSLVQALFPGPGWRPWPRTLSWLMQDSLMGISLRCPPWHWRWEWALSWMPKRLEAWMNIGHLSCSCVPMFCFCFFMFEQNVR